MSMLNDLIAECRPVTQHRPYPRFVVDAEAWSTACIGLADGACTLLALWAETDTVHMALIEEAASAVAVVSLPCPNGRYPSVGRLHPPALRLERTIRDLFGLEPEGLPDSRPWLDHGQWGRRHPLGSPQPDGPAVPYAFLPAEGRGLSQIAVGPVHAGIIEPGHFRFTTNGETVVRLEQRLGYTHKGVESLMRGAGLDQAVRLAGRVSGDSTVAYALAFSRAAEAALGTQVPPRAAWLRALMAELERLANHFGDIGAVCNDASFSIMHAHCGGLRERVLRAADAVFGHRLMRDRIVPGGVTADIDRDAAAGIRATLAEIRQRLPKLISIYDNTTSLQDRTVGTGTLSPALARQYGAGGFVGRASGRRFDARRALRYAPYDVLSFDVPELQDGDVNARVWIRIREVEQSLGLIEQILDTLPTGAILSELATASEPREGMSIVEGFRGDVLAWLRLDVNGAVARCHLRDPSWFQWPLLEAVIEGNIVADFPLCNKSFNCSYSGQDL